MARCLILQLPQRDFFLLNFVLFILFVGGGCKGRGQIGMDGEIKGIRMPGVKATKKINKKILMEKTTCKTKRNVLGYRNLFRAIDVILIVL